MVGGLAKGNEDTGAVRHPAFYAKQVITVAFVALIVVMLRVSGVGGTGFAGELAFGLAALIPAAAMRRPTGFAFRQGAFEEMPAVAMAPEMAAS
jgi:hypothetical protein